MILTTKRSSLLDYYLSVAVYNKAISASSISVWIVVYFYETVEAFHNKKAMPLPFVPTFLLFWKSKNLKWELIKVSSGHIIAFSEKAGMLNQNWMGLEY